MNEFDGPAAWRHRARQQPDVAELDGANEILQFNRTGRWCLRRRAAGGGTGEFNVVLHQHSIPPNGGTRVGDFDVAVPTCSQEIDVESFPRAGRASRVRGRIALSPNGASFIRARDRPAIAIENLDLKLALEKNAAVRERVLGSARRAGRNKEFQVEQVVFKGLESADGSGSRNDRQ